MANEDVSKSALEEVTQAAFNGVFRALEARRLSIEQFPGPIIVGIIAWPDLRRTELAKEVESGGAEQ